MKFRGLAIGVALNFCAVGLAAAETIDIGVGHQSMCTDTYPAGIIVKELKLLEKHLPRTGKYAGSRVLNCGRRYGYPRGPGRADVIA